MRCRHRLSKLLLRHGRVWDRSAWTKAHREWLSAQTFEQANTELAFIDNLAACDGLTARKDALDERLSWVASDPEFWPLVRRLRAFRGIDTLSALIIVLEVCDFAQVRARGAARIVAGAGALPRAVRRVRSPWVDHQDRLEVRPADPGRGGLALRPPAEDRRTLYERQEGLARPCPADRTTRPDPPLPDPPADAGAQQAGQRDHRRVRARARLLSLGRRHRAVAHTDSPSPLGWGGAGPRSPLVRAMVLWAALTRPRPILDTRQPATQPGTWGSQPPHMRLTDVENFARRLPTRATRLTNPQTTAPRGTFNAAHLTDAPPYEHLAHRARTWSGGWRRARFPREAGPRCGAARMLVSKQVFERDPDVLAGGEGSARREFLADACPLGLAWRIGRCGVCYRPAPDRHGGYGAREGCDDQRGGAAPGRRFGGHHEHHPEH